MLKKIFIFIILSISTPAFADKAADIAEFRKLYAEFNDLYENSEEIDTIIKVAEKLYKLAPKTYTKNSQQHAVVTYNLATLYDEKGDNRKYNNKDEKRASELYEKYFKIQDSLGVEKDRTYLTQFTQYMVSYYHSHVFQANISVAKNMLDIVYKLELPNIERANYEYYAAILIADFVHFDSAIPHFQNALNMYLNEVGTEHLKIGELNLILARQDMIRKNNAAAIDKLFRAAKAFEASEQDGDELKINAYQNIIMNYAILGKPQEREKYIEVVRAFDPALYPTTDTPLPIKRVTPRYPSAAYERGLNGYVIVNFSVDANGNTKDVKAVEYSDKVFVTPSLNAAKKYQYNPPSINGEISEYNDVRIRIEFVLAESVGAWRRGIPDKIFSSQY